MEIDTKAFLDEAIDAWPGPKVGVESKRGWGTLQPRDNLALLVAIKLGLRAEMGFGRECFLALVPSGRHPKAHRTFRDVQDARHFGRARPFADSPDGAARVRYRLITVSYQADNRKTRNRQARFASCENNIRRGNWLP
jgi:hypothetical protein